MIKYLGKPAVVFSEFPDEISLVFNITNCTGTCPHCSEPELRQDIGLELTDQILDVFVEQNPGITLVGLMGEGRDHSRIIEIARHIHDKYKLKVGVYSGRDEMDLDLLGCLDYYKYGRFIMPTGPSDTWLEQNAGPLCFPNTNQVMLKKCCKDNQIYFEDITYKFQQVKINDLRRTIIE